MVLIMRSVCVKNDILKRSRRLLWQLLQEADRDATRPVEVAFSVEPGPPQLALPHLLHAVEPIKVLLAAGPEHDEVAPVLERGRME